MIIKPGIFQDLSSEDYHSHKESISRSAIMDFAESPYLYWAKHLNPDKPAKYQTAAMDFGNAFHTYVLEPELFKEQYAIEPRAVKLKDVGRKLYDEYKDACTELENSKKTILTDNDFMLICNMFIALKTHNEAWELIQGGIYEQSYFWQDKESGLLVKSRPDILHSNMYVDLKTCASASTRAYQKAMVDGGYHIQAALVVDAVRELEGREIEACINICIEKTYPYQIGIKIISDEALEAGRKKYKSVLMDLSRAITYNHFQQYQPEIVNLPGWMA